MYIFGDNADTPHMQFITTQRCMFIELCTHYLLCTGAYTSGYIIFVTVTYSRNIDGCGLFILHLVPVCILKEAVLLQGSNVLQSLVLVWM